MFNTLHFEPDLLCTHAKFGEKTGECFVWERVAETYGSATAEETGV